VGEDELRPLGMRTRDDRPVDQPLADDPAALLPPWQRVAARERRVDALERVRGDDAREGDGRVGAVTERRHPRREPRRHVLERLGVGMEDPLALQPGVEVRGVDELRAARVGGRCDGPDELFLPELGRDPDDLAGLDVRAVDGELGENLEPLVRHGRRSYRRDEPEQVTIGAAIDRFIDAAGISDATRRAYASDLRDFAAWYGDRPLEEVDVRVLADYTADLGRARPGGKLAPSTISRRLAAVRSLLRFTLGPAHVPEVPLAPRRARRLPDAPKPAEVDDLIEAAGDGDDALALRNRALLEVVYSAGLRS